MLTNDDYFRLGQITAEYPAMNDWERETIRWLISRLEELNKKLDRAVLF